jgi:hypothetical protein
MVDGAYCHQLATIVLTSLSCQDNIVRPHYARALHIGP